MGLYLPSVIRSGVGEMVIAVDTSGSIGAEELQEFAAEITAISGEYRPECIHVVYADAAVHGSEAFGPDDPVVLHPAGGGGTDLRPAFEWVAKQGLVPKCFLYLTDLCCDSYRFVSVLLALGGINPRLTRYQQDRSVLAPGSVAIQTYKSIAEIDYNVQIAPWLSIRPNLQYVVRPGGSGNIPNAFVIGLHTGVTF